MSGRLKRLAACAQCGVAFHPRSNSARRFCSVTCAGLAKAKPAIPDPGVTPEERARAARIAADCLDAYQAVKEGSGHG
ncbi:MULTISPECIES: hypothetical protein [unclassified Microbacterium]|uniref:hypothetical protein n=1 Tax=unclassified Microbacterium TaxID=2609290 RepID=UPI0030169AC7